MKNARRSPPVGRRLAAFGLDYLVVLGYLIVLGGVGLALTLGPASGDWARLVASPLRMDLVAFCTTVLPVGAYFSLFESSWRGATLGKRRMRLRVVRLGGGRLSLWRAVLRAAAKLLPWQLAHTSMFHYPGWPTNPQSPPLWVTTGLALVWVLVGFYILTIIVRSDGRAPYDWIAGSAVIPQSADGVG